MEGNKSSQSSMTALDGHFLHDDGHFFMITFFFFHFLLMKNPAFHQNKTKRWANIHIVNPKVGILNWQFSRV